MSFRAARRRGAGTMDNDGEREREREDVNVIGGASNQSNPEARHCVMEQEHASKRRLTSPDTDVTRSRTQVPFFLCTEVV